MKPRRERGIRLSDTPLSFLELTCRSRNGLVRQIHSATHPIILGLAANKAVRADVAKLVDAPALGAGGATHPGSSPGVRMKYKS